MYATGTKKMLNLMILKILESYSDEDHRLTQKRIIELLDTNYGMECDRRSVSKNINSLKEMDYDIVKEKDGCYIVREFEDWELRVLIDSVLFSKSISKSKTKDLISKLKSLGNNYFEAKVKHIVSLQELQRSDNSAVERALDTINDAISKNKKISFVYNSYGTDFKLHPRREEPYIVNPYQMVATNGRYYLICNYDKYDNISHYRIDKMTDVKILKDKVKPKREVKDFANNDFNLPKHLAEHIYMFSGKSIRVKFWTTVSMLDAIVDWFGRKIDILQREDNRLLIGVYVNETAMKFWAMQYGEGIEIIYPKSLRETIKQTAEKIFIKHGGVMN